MAFLCLFGSTIGTLEVPSTCFFLDSLIYSSSLSRLAKVADLYSNFGHSLRTIQESWGTPLPVYLRTWIGCAS